MDPKSNVKAADKCRLCLVSGYFHINIFDMNTTQRICDVIQEIFHCEVYSNVYSSIELIYSPFKSSRSLIKLTSHKYERNCLQINEFDSLPNHVCVECWMTVQKFHQFYQAVLSTQKKYLAGNYPEVKVEVGNDEIMGYYEDFLDSVSNREGKFTFSQKNYKQN